MKINSNDQTLKQQINSELKYHIRDPSFNEIIENIYVGNYAFALNKKLLLENKITHILNCGNGLKNFYEKEGIFKYKQIPLYDSKTQNLIQFVNEINNFIEEGSINNNKVLIHCGEGVSRSAAVCLMYLITKKGLCYTKARETFEKKRAGCCPNNGFVAQLKQKSLELYHKE